VLQFVYASDWMFLSHYKLENMSFLKGLSYGSHKRMDYSKRNIFILALSVTDSWGGSSMAPYDYFSSEGADRSLKSILFKALWRVCAVGALLSSTMASRCNLTRFLFSRCFSRIKSWLLTGKKKMLNFGSSPKKVLQSTQVEFCRARKFQSSSVVGKLQKQKTGSFVFASPRLALPLLSDSWSSKWKI
jgi:hypothetical protein